MGLVVYLVIFLGGVDIGLIWRGIRDWKAVGVAGGGGGRGSLKGLMSAGGSVEN